MRDALDGIVEYDPQLLVDHDLDPTSYTGNARFSQGFFDLAAVLGHPVAWMIQETYSGRSQEGYDVGVFDCQFAESRARERGWRGPIAYVVSDGNYADGWDCSGYARGISDAASVAFEFHVFGYGAHGVLDSFVRGALAGRGAGLLVLGTDQLGGRWVPETWGPTNLVGQVVGFSPVPDTDLNHVYVELGAPAPAPAPPLPPEGEMELVVIPTYPFTGGHLARLCMGDGRKIQDWQSDASSEVNGISTAAFAAAPKGTPVRIFTDVPAAGAWLAASNAASAPAQPVAITDAQVAALAHQVVALLPPDAPLDPVALAEAIAGHLEVTVAAK